MVKEVSRSFRLTAARAKRWRDWALGIDGANELSGQALTNFLPFVDTSEIVEYVLPTSLLSGSFPSRLDLSLSLLFELEGGLFVFSPHATELDSVREGWQERMRQVSHELRMLHEHYERSADARQVEQQLTALAREGLRSRAEDLVTLLRDNHRWIFAAWRVPSNELPGFFDNVLARITVPSAHELELSENWIYSPAKKRVDEWMSRLDNTDKGRGEPGPNLVDAYALDQLEQAASARRSGRLPIFFTHSGKILDAIGNARASDKDFLRVGGISLVQPPHVALVLRLREDSEAAGLSTELARELERQRDRCQRIVAFVADLAVGGEDVQSLPEYQGLDRELKDLDEVAEKWDALQKVRQSIDPGIKTRTTPLLKGIERVLAEAVSADDRFERLLGDELNKLIQDIDRLQEQIAARAPFQPVAALDLDKTAIGEITASVRPGLFSRAPREYAVPSATYSISSFSFRDPKIIPYLKDLADVLETLGKPLALGEARALLRRASDALQAASALAARPEYYLLLAVVCLAQEKWLEATTAVERGIKLIHQRDNPAIDRSVHGELLLARANAIRAHVLATRVEIRSICEDLLNYAVKSCLACLDLQGTVDSHAFLQARCLRELAVILSSSCEAVFGLGSDRSPLKLEIDRSKLGKWIPINDSDDAPTLAAMLARCAFRLGSQDSRVPLFFVNTHLYAMTEIDRRLIDESREPANEAERIDVAKMLQGEEGPKDPNFIDSLMWHKYVLSRGHQQRNEPWNELLAEARALASTVEADRLAANRYYQLLIELHKKAILPPATKKGKKDKRRRRKTIRAAAKGV